MGILWLLIEIGFAYHGWSAVNRYLIEPAGVMVVIAGGAVGHLLADSRGSRVLRWAGPIAVVALIVALAPAAGTRARETRVDVRKARAHGKQVDRLHDVIAKLGGPALVKSCGHPVSFLGFQSTLAWEVGLNVGNIGFRPGRSIDGATRSSCSGRTSSAGRCGPSTYPSRCPRSAGRCGPIRRWADAPAGSPVPPGHAPRAGQTLRSHRGPLVQHGPEAHERQRPHVSQHRCRLRLVLLRALLRLAI